MLSLNDLIHTVDKSIAEALNALDSLKKLEVRESKKLQIHQMEEELDEIVGRKCKLCNEATQLKEALYDKMTELEQIEIDAEHYGKILSRIVKGVKSHKDNHRLSGGRLI